MGDSIRDIAIRLSVETDPAKRQALYNDLGKIYTRLERIEKQANETRASMQKLAQVGAKLALVGAAILAPFALAMKKYTDTVKDTEPTSKRILELSKKWEDSQVRLGRVVATTVLPLLEQGAVVLEQVISFAEKNPGIVQAALTIGTTLVVLGGIITTTAQLVAAVATIQGLAASAGIAIGGGGAAAGVAGAASAGGAAVTAGAAGIITAIAPVAVGALALAIGGNVGLAVGNAIAGTNQTWDDILLTVKEILVINALALDNVSRFFGKDSDLEGIVSRALGISDKFVVDSTLRNTKTQTNELGGIFLKGIGFLANPLGSIAEAIMGLIGQFSGAHAAGDYTGSNGYKGFGLYGEKGREFTLNNNSTRNAERAIGGRLTQQSLMAAVTQNFQVGRGNTISQTRKIVRGEMRSFKQDFLTY